MLAELAAREMGRVPLVDALQLVKLYGSAGSPKAEPAAVLWLASTAVRERHAARSRAGSPPSLRLATIAGTALFLSAATSLVFAAVESYVHWRAGLGVHGLQCLIGPEHRDALPLLAALSVIAAACHGALAHLLGWMRETLALLVSRPRSAGRRPLVVRRPSAAPALRPFLPGPHDPRGPPSFASV